MRGAGFASPGEDALLWRRWDFSEAGRSLRGEFACEELDVEQTHEEKQSNPKNHQQEAQARPADEPLQVHELVPSRRPGDRHQPDLTGVATNGLQE
jgi:hypothetical protein